MNGRIDNLKILVEREHGCRATHIETAVIREKIDEKSPRAVWEGVIETFQLEGHPTAKRAYAWEIPPSREHPEPEYKVVLGVSPINSANDAVKVAIVAQVRQLLRIAEEQRDR